MASTNKTEHLGLNAWVEADRPQRNDFNSDNIIIDNTLGEHLDSSSMHLTETEKSRVSNPYVVVPYAGTGSETLKVTLPLVAKGVIVYREDMPFSTFDSVQSVTMVYGAVAFPSAGASAGVTLSSNGYVTVKQSATATNGIKHCLNESGCQYRVIAFR